MPAIYPLYRYTRLVHPYCDIWGTVAQRMTPMARRLRSAQLENRTARLKLPIKWKPLSLDRDRARNTAWISAAAKGRAGG